MQHLPDEIYSVAAVREIDRTAIDVEGIPGYTLMTRAGEAAVREARQRYPETRRWQVICGAGNNGGDGYVVARLALNEGIAVSVLALVDPATLTGDAETAFRDYERANGVAIDASADLDPDAELVFDALLGSGLERNVEGTFARVVAAINAHDAAVIALDIPTGIHGDTGAAMGAAISADVTVTFVGLKAGLFLRDGLVSAGDVVFAGLGIPDHCRDPSAAVLKRIGQSQLEQALGRRRRDAHKGDFGHVVVVGGGPGMPGAVRLCGEAALRAGAGRVSLATHPSHAAAIVASRPELMSHGVATARDLEPLLRSADVVAFGPGLGESDWAEEIYEAVAASTVPAVWDADALNWLANSGGRSETRIITPHPGEAGRLLGIATAEVQADRVSALAGLRRAYGGVAVLKAAGTLVSTAATLPLICTSGNPGMAAPGMGDVLTGIVAAFLGQGLDLEEAAAVGVEAHARAGDLAARLGERGLMASDLMAELRAVLNS